MNYDDLKEIIHLLTDRNIEEFAIERGSESVRIKRSVNGRMDGQVSSPTVLLSGTLPVQPRSSQHSPSLNSTSEITAAADLAELHYLKSPTVGIFRKSRSHGSQPLAEPGKMVETGQVICCIEVLRLFNDVVSDASGEVVKQFVIEGQPVEYGQTLFAIRAQS